MMIHMDLLDDFNPSTGLTYNVNIEDGEWLIFFGSDTEYDGESEETLSGLECSVSHGDDLALYKGGWVHYLGILYDTR